MSCVNKSEKDRKLFNWTMSEYEINWYLIWALDEADTVFGPETDSLSDWMDGNWMVSLNHSFLMNLKFQLPLQLIKYLECTRCVTTEIKLVFDSNLGELRFERRKKSLAIDLAENSRKQ